MSITKKSIIGEIVAMDYHTASVFKSHKIDFCCSGGRSIEEACQSVNVSTNGLLNELTKVLKERKSLLPDFKSWDMDLLADFIEKKHHRYVRRSIPELKIHLNKLVKTYSKAHPELRTIETLFTASAQDLLQHLEKEESFLFPYIRKMKESKNKRADVIKPPFDTLQNPIQMMKHEHEQEGERFIKIAALSNNYTPPEDASNIYRATFAMLKEFQEDLHLHIHLENNILFPKAIEAEKRINHH